MMTGAPWQLLADRVMSPRHRQDRRSRVAIASWAGQRFQPVLAREASQERAPRVIIRDMLTVFGATAVTFMMVMYALERRHRGFVLAFACGCALSSAYGFLAGTWPFGVVEAIWALIALRRYTTERGREQRMGNLPQGSK
jgi:hypothetical protein